MGRSRSWTVDNVEDMIIPKLEAGKSVQEVARFYGMSRQRMYKILDEAGYDSKGNLKESGDES